MLARQSRVLLGVAAAALLALLVVFAVELIDSQSTARRDVEDRLGDRAKASAALTESLFTSAGASVQAENARRYGTEKVSPRLLAADLRESNGIYLMVLSEDGRIISSAPGTPPAAIRSVRARPPYVRRVLAGSPYALSAVQRAGLPAPAIGYAQPFETRFGRRVAVSGTSAQLINQFLGGSLEQIPNVKAGRAYVLDRFGRIVASPDEDVKPGQAVREPGLRAALANGDRGSFGDDKYFASDGVAGSQWRVVLTAPKSELFASVSGARKWVPWILFIGFGIVAVVALVLVYRVLRDAGKLTAANAQLGLANRTLERRAVELRRSNEELERFASIASHDLQEPLRKVQTFAEQLERREGDRLSDKGRDYLERMGSAARRMQALIDDLLAFSRISTGSVETQEVDLGELAREVVADLDAVIAETGATVELGSLPTVSADPLQMRQLLQNLVSNALKFRRQGVDPIVRIEGRVRGDTAELTVSDNGIGFDQRYAGRIFRVFERLHGQSAYTGTGIGLALCRRIAERHRGTISAESTPGEGSTFTVTLPHGPHQGPSDGPTETREEERLVHA
jgi:signal transduction histidine kinase